MKINSKKQIVCKICGRTFPRTHSKQSYCSAECAILGKRRMARECFLRNRRRTLAQAEAAERPVPRFESRPAPAPAKVEQRASGRIITRGRCPGGAPSRGAGFWYAVCQRY